MLWILAWRSPTYYADCADSADFAVKITKTPQVPKNLGMFKAFVTCTNNTDMQTRRRQAQIKQVDGNSGWPGCKPCC